METYDGKRTSSTGEFVAVGPANEIAEAALSGEVEEVILENLAVARVRVTRAGSSFERYGSRWAYGYLEDAHATDGVA